MRFRALTAAVASTLALCAGAASAQATGDAQAGIGISTLGATLEGSYRILPELRLRGLLAGGLSVDGTEEFEGTEFSLDASLGGAALLADYYVTGGNWRVSGGIFASNTDLEANAVATADNPFEYDGRTFSGGEQLRTTAGPVNDVSLMLLTGYDLPVANNWVLSGEVGAIFIGGVDVTATSNDPDVQEAVNADPDVRDAIDTARDIVAYPYLGVSMAFRF